MEKPEKREQDRISGDYVNSHGPDAGGAATAEPCSFALFT